MNIRYNMRLLSSCCWALLFCQPLSASLIYASTLGYNPDDASAAFREAWQSDYDTIIFDQQQADWMVGPNLFFDLHDKVVIFEPGLVLRAIPGAFPDPGDCLLKLIRCHNITIIGYGATFIMNKSEYAQLNDSEYRHCLHIDNCVQMTVKGLSLRDSGGDGIYVGGADWWQEARTYSEDIWLEDLNCINNYRQGMSICSVQNMEVRHCLFTQTEGTLPEAGVDIEPFEPYQRIINLNFRHCSFTHNAWTGIALALFELNGSSLPVSIHFTDCYTSQNGSQNHPYNSVEIFASADRESPVQGTVTFERCLVENSQWGAFYTRKTSDAYQLNFKNCAFQSVSQQQIPFNEPIFLEVPSYDSPSPALGGISFDNLLITYPTDFDFLRVYGWSTLEGLANISGRITVIEPFGNGVWYQNVADTSNLTFSYTTQTAVPPVELNLLLSQLVAAECTTDIAHLSVSRQSSRLDYPLPVRYVPGGAPDLGNDIHRPTNSLLIPAFDPGFTDSFTLAARPDALEEESELLSISLLGSPLYTLGTDSLVLLQIVDCALTPINSTEPTATIAQVDVYPSPATSLAFIRTNIPLQDAHLQVYNSLGQMMWQQPHFNGHEIELAVSEWPKGIYYLHIHQLSAPTPLTLQKQWIKG